MLRMLNKSMLDVKLVQKHLLPRHPFGEAIITDYFFLTWVSHSYSRCKASQEAPSWQRRRSYVLIKVRSLKEVLAPRSLPISPPFPPLWLSDLHPVRLLSLFLQVFVVQRSPPLLAYWVGLSRC